MSSLEKVEDASSPIRGPGDGMETEQTGEAAEVITGANATNRQIHHSPLKKTVSSLSPGVLQLGKIHADKSVEIEAIRIVVPKAAITHVVPTKNAKVAKSVGHKGEVFHQSDGATDPKKEQTELKNAVEKLKNSEKRLLQDKEGLSNQLRIQTEVNRELKKLLVASVGDDLQYHFERMAREKNQLILENEVLGRNLSQLSEQLERMSIQCDVWRSKFLASRVMSDELTNTRAILQRQTRDAQSAIQDLLSERDQFRREMSDTHKLLEELMVSLQWGRQQTYYPSAQPYTTTELAAVNCKLAKAVSSHLLGNTGTNSPKKTSAAVEFCSTPAEKMAEMVLHVLDPAAHTETSTEVSFSETSPSSFLSTKKNIGRFHPYTRYEDCSATCGVGAVWRSVRCSSGSDGACATADKPVPARRCSLRPCSSWRVGNWSKCSRSCGGGVKVRDVHCVDTRDQRLLRPFHCQAVLYKPPEQVPCQSTPCLDWYTSSWRECSEACGGGEQERLVTCPELGRCEETLRPNTTRPCNTHPCTTWVVGSWGECTAPCGGGIQRRQVKCINTKTGLAEEDSSLCDHEPWPESTQKCNPQDCDSSESGFVCERDRLTFAFCQTLRVLGRCHLPTVHLQCCQSCRQHGHDAAPDRHRGDERAARR